MTANRKNSVASKTPQRQFCDFHRTSPPMYFLPMSVCLYSEDRKFFLHGEAVLCGGRGDREKWKVSAGDRSPAFEELSDRQDRGSDQAAARSPIRRCEASRAFDGAVAGYWASLGLPLDVAEQNLRNCPVRVEAIDVKGGKELAAALSKLGVQIAKRSPKLTITLVNDYLDRRLAEMNRERVADKTPWLLVQPSGVFPLVGPVFRPGESACWNCLFDRMIRNREIKRISRPRTGAGGSRIAPGQRHRGTYRISLRCRRNRRKRLLRAFAPICGNHIASLDLTGAVIAKHFVARRPQCPICGSKKLQNPRRAATPIEIAEGSKLVMTSGGYRTVTSRATVARFRKHVSPLTGVVTRLERIEVDLPMNTNFFAYHNFSAPAQSVDQLRSGLSGGSFGKGSTAEQGEASALMEAIERYSGIFQGDEIRTARRFTDFAPGDALHPNDIQLFSETQFQNRHAEQPDDSHPVPEPFDPSMKTEWSPVWSLRDKRFKFLPTGLLYFFYGGFHTDSNGCAAGNTREEAIVQGFLELVERDAYAIWWYNRLQRAELDLKQFDDSMSGICKPSLPMPGAGYGCSTSPAISAFPLTWRSCTGCRTATRISSSVPARISIAA